MEISYFEHGNPEFDLSHQGRHYHIKDISYQLYVDQEEMLRCKIDYIKADKYDKDWNETPFTFTDSMIKLLEATIPDYINPDHLDLFESYEVFSSGKREGSCY